MITYDKCQLNKYTFLLLKFEGRNTYLDAMSILALYYIFCFNYYKYYKDRFKKWALMYYLMY